MGYSPRIKICCISSLQEAEAAVRAGASIIGLVGDMPSGPGVIEDETIQEIASKIQPHVATWLLTSETSADSIIEHHRRVNTSAIQIVDMLQSGNYRQIRKALPGVHIIQVIHILDGESIREAEKVVGEVDALLLDSGNPNSKIKELGGTGRVHNWEISRQICERIKKPLFLAGGLTAENISQAIETVNPYGVDICSGVRTEGKLDEGKLNRLIEAVKEISNRKGFNSKGS